MSIDFSSVWALCYFEPLNFQVWSSLLTWEQAGSIRTGAVPCALWLFYAQDSQRQAAPASLESSSLSIAAVWTRNK